MLPGGSGAVSPADHSIQGPLSSQHHPGPPAPVSGHALIQLLDFVRPDLALRLRLPWFPWLLRASVTVRLSLFVMILGEGTEARHTAARLKEEDPVVPDFMGG